MTKNPISKKAISTYLINRDRMDYLRRLLEWNKLKNIDNTATEKEYNQLGQENHNLLQRIEEKLDS